MLAVLFMVFLILLLLAVAAPRVATELRREKEEETIHRGLQYVRAIRLFYKHFGRYPITLDELDSSSNIRFLRQHYPDPFTGKTDWRMIHRGEATVPSLGLFGQPNPASMLVLANTNQVGTPIASAANGGSGNGPGSGSGSLFDSPSTGSGNGFGNQNGAGGSGSFGSSPGSFGNASGSFGVQSAQGSFGSQGNSFGTNGTQGSTSSGLGNSGTPGASNGTGSTQPLQVSHEIIGVGLPFDHKSVKAYRKQENYNRWEFVYDPASDRISLVPTQAGAPVGTPIGTNNPIGSTGATSPTGINGAAPNAGSTPPATQNPPSN